MSLLNIKEVALVTGISKETLRKWEIRYGFPMPTRNNLGIRLYSSEDINKIHTIKSLLNRGERIGQIARLSEKELSKLLDVPSDRHLQQDPLFKSIFEYAKVGDTASIRHLLLDTLNTLGLESFVLQFLAPLLNEIGMAWHNGVISIGQEHLCTTEITRILTDANSRIVNRDDSIRVLLATPPYELHAVGLKMVESMVLLGGGAPIYLGTQTPLDEIVQMSVQANVKVVAISVSAAYPLKEFRQFFKKLDEILPEEVLLWVGGAGAREVYKTSRMRRLALGEIQANLSLLI